MNDDELEFLVTVAQNRSGGARLKLGSVPYDEILPMKGRFLYNPNDGVEDNNLCFCLCLAHSADAAVSDQEKMEYAKQLHNAVGLDHMRQVLFTKVTKF